MSLTNNQLALLLANCIKRFGKENTLEILDQQVHNPFQISLHPTAYSAMLVLLEGQKQIDAWQKTLNLLEETIHEVPERGGEPDEQAE